MRIEFVDTGFLIAMLPKSLPEKQVPAIQFEAFPAKGPERTAQEWRGGFPDSVTRRAHNMLGSKTAGEISAASCQLAERKFQATSTRDDLVGAILASWMTLPPTAGNKQRQTVRSEESSKRVFSSDDVDQFWLSAGRNFSNAQIQAV